MEEKSENKFLGGLLDRQVHVSIYLMNGIRLRGKVVSFDDSVLCLKSATTQLVYKHAISTVAIDQQVEKNFPGP